MPQPSANLQRLAWLLDSSIRIPGTRFTLGLDALIGLLPGIGDLIGTLLSSYIVAEAWRGGTPLSVLTRMGFNVLLEGVLGAVPILGDVFDAVWKANQRNLRLMQAHAREPRRTVRTSRLFLVLLLGSLLLIAALAAYALYGLFVWLGSLGAP